MNIYKKYYKKYYKIIQAYYIFVLRLYLINFINTHIGVW